jgi:hypothetical protein
LDLSGPHIGAHIRWGDKKSEALPVSARVYAHLLKEKADQLNTRTIFLMSDSSDAVHEIVDLLPDYHIKTTTPTYWKGNEMDSFFELPREERENQARLLILEMTIMSQSSHVVCTMSSNVCRLIQVIREQPPETMTGIDMLAPSWACSLARWLPFVQLEIEYCVDAHREWFPF